MNSELRDFETQVVQRSGELPVLVDFWAPWCGPCRTLGPVLERMAAVAGDRWELVKVNVNEHQDLAGRFNIASIPAVKLFVKGEVVDEFVGALSERDIRRFVEKATPSPYATQVKETEQLLAQGANAQAAAMLEEVVRNEPQNISARILLAQAFLGVAPDKISAVLEPLRADSEMADNAGALRILAGFVDISKRQASLPESPVLPTYLAAAAAVRAGDYPTAISALLEVLNKDKGYDNGGAKEACRAIFQLLGRQHPVVQQSFRAFSSAIHS